jgi:DtxR family Mn-dependent transcriptional regulator
MYLKGIWYLSGGNAVRPADIAAALAVSRPSVTGALARLANDGLLTHVPYGDVRLTPAGRRMAQALAAADDKLRGMETRCAL